MSADTDSVRGPDIVRIFLKIRTMSADRRTSSVSNPTEDTYSLLLSCFDPENHEFDMAKMENLKKSRRSESIESVGVVTKKPYVQRRVYSKRDPCNTNWYQEYVVNVNGTWSNPLHRDFNLFRRRFVIDQPSFIELVNTIRSLTDMNASRRFANECIH